MRLSSLAIALLLTLTGCSGRAPYEFPGKIVALSVTPKDVSSTYNIHARVIFQGDVEPPTLAIVPGNSNTTVQVMATSRIKQHFLGLGIFPVDTETPHTYELDTPVILLESTTYRFEGLSGDDHAVTAVTEKRP